MKKYITPEIETINVVLENGIAQSGGASPSGISVDTSDFSNSTTYDGSGNAI